jgi:hypothetical protein
MGQFFCNKKQHDNNTIQHEESSLFDEQRKEYEVLKTEHVQFKKDVNILLDTYKRDHDTIKNQLYSLNQDLIDTTFYLNKLKKSKSKLKQSLYILKKKEQYVCLDIKHVVPSNKPYSITFHGSFNTKYNCYCYNTILNPILDITFSNMNKFVYLKTNTINDTTIYDKYKINVKIIQGIDIQTQKQPVNISISNNESIRLSVNNMKYIGLMDIDLDTNNTMFSLYDDEGNDITYQLNFHHTTNTTCTSINWDY